MVVYIAVQNSLVAVFFPQSSCCLVNRDDSGLLESLLEASSEKSGLDNKWWIWENRKVCKMLLTQQAPSEERKIPFLLVL